jgi:uncharacterized repeat protein (TIGR02543 family)
VNSRGSSTTYWFEWGTTTGYGNQTSSQSLPGDYATRNVNAPLSGLSPNTTYHYRVCAQNAQGTVCGNDMTFTTPPPPNQLPTVDLTCQNQGVGNRSVSPSDNGFPDCSQGVDVGDTILLTGSASDPDGSIVKCEFDFNGDGIYDYTETPTNAPDGTFDCATQTSYSTPGTRTVQVRVTDNSGGTAADSVSLPVAVPQFTLTVTKQGTGTGSVTGTGINCGTDCTEPYNSGTVVTLTATPNSGSAFAGWSGDCTGSTPTTQITMNADKTCVATFNLAQFTLSITRVGTGFGTVTGIGIDCGTDCTEPYSSGTVVTLTATPGFGSTFAGWSLGCAGTSPTTQVTMDANKTCVATFNRAQFTLTVTRVGTGSGTVSGNGINCGSDCTEPYDAGTVVFLGASPDAGSVFGGWFGDCTGTSTSTQVTMDANKTCTARFDIEAGGREFRLHIFLSGTGTGTVNYSPPGSGTGACPPSCGPFYQERDQVWVNLTPVPDSGSTFAGWQELDCSSGAVLMNTDRICTAIFNSIVPVTLSVVLQTENIDDTVNINPPNVTCDYTGTNCLQSYTPGTAVTLTAQPGPNSRFVNWNGACSGTDLSIQIVVSVDMSCTASFAPLAPPDALLHCQNQTVLGGLSQPPPDCLGLNLDTYLLDGSPSSDTSPGVITRYEFDFTCDGTYDYSETSSNAPDGNFDGMTTTTYPGIFSGNACLRVTDDDGMQDTDSVTMDVKEVTIDVTPPSANVILNGTQQFNAALGNVAQSPPFNDVSWSIVSGPGTIDSTGFYTAPGTLPPDPTVTVRACSVVDPTKCDTAVITLVSSVIGCTAPVVNLTSPQPISGVMEQNTTGGPFDAHSTGMANDAAGFVYVATGYISNPLANDRTDSQWITKIDLNQSPAIASRLNSSAINADCPAGSDHCLTGLVVLQNGDVVVAGLFGDTFNSRLYRVTQAGAVSVFSEEWIGGPFIFTGYGGDQTGLALDGQGNVWVAASGYHAIVRVPPGGGRGTLMAGTPADPTPSGYLDGPALSAKFRSPSGLSLDCNGNIVIAERGIGDTFNNQNNAAGRIRRLILNGPNANTVVTVAGDGNTISTDNANPLLASFDNPLAIAVDAGNNLYVTDHDSCKFRRIDAGSNIKGADGTAPNGPVTTPISLSGHCNAPPENPVQENFLEYVAFTRGGGPVVYINFRGVRVLGPLF